MTTHDVIIVGAGPAGLTAATYLARFRRKVLVLDGGPPRASWIPESHNTPGFPEGVGGETLLARMRDQAQRYGASIEQRRADRLERSAAGCTVIVEGQAISAAFVLLATGVVDIKPDVPGLDVAIRRSLVRVCPICDAFEAVDKRIAVLTDGDLGLREARFLQTYSPDVTVLTVGTAFSDEAAASAPGVAIAPTELAQITLTDREIIVGERRFDCLYLAFGCEMENRLALRWGAEHDRLGNLIVDAHQQTSLDRIYAAGDVVRGLNQIAVAVGEAAIAATDIHNRLRAAGD